MSHIDERLDDEARLMNSVMKQERATVHNAVARAERAETALKKALQHIEALEALLYTRIRDGYVCTDGYVNKGGAYVRSIRKQCEESLAHAGEEGFQSDFEVRLRLKVLDDLMEVFRKHS